METYPISSASNIAVANFFHTALRRVLFALVLGAMAILAPPAARADTMYVSSDGQSIVKVNSDATHSTFSTLPANSGPYGLAFDGSGNLYAMDYASPGISEISKITPDGTPSHFATLPAGSERGGLAFDTSGNLYAADYGISQISKITPDGTVSFFANVPSPQGLAFDGSGNLYAMDYYTKQINKITPGGTVSLFATLPPSDYSSAYGLAFDGSGNLYAVDYSDYELSGRASQIDKITPGGAVSLFATLAPVATQPVGLAFDSSGNLYVADSLNNQIDKITSGGVVSTFATGISQPTYLAFAVPEPATVTLLVLGGVALLMRKRRGLE